MNPVKVFALTTALLCAGPLAASPQDTTLWNNKQCAVVLTYDDAIDAHLDNAVPALDSLKLRGTFYLIGSVPVVTRRLNEWRLVAKHGHELGNHTMYHPCDSRLPGRGFVTPDHDLSKYTVERAVNEIRATNALLKKIDGKTARTFAYPCGERQIGNAFFYDQLRKDFVATRGVTPGLQTDAQVDLADVNCYPVNGQSGAYLIDLVQKAQQSHTLLVFLFHGVGGGHHLNVDLQAHRHLLHYLKAHEKDIWVAPMVEVAEKIRASQQVKSATK
ncbi:polysaccharide deacetylase family protein [Hymenobacter terrenus]|uniref:polysaccharide deacetylase family protein n=1 Tax=Hymenobacter terrenus TaxID=1629124 RepID=UPI000698BC84|nr:polysaccharide deacetylase family protein [Hymenobacter terrenus]